MVHGDMSGKRTFEEALMDVVGEEAIDMAKNRRMYYWDKRKKKFVFVRGGSAQRPMGLPPDSHTY